MRCWRLIGWPQDATWRSAMAGDHVAGVKIHVDEEVEGSMIERVDQPVTITGSGPRGAVWVVAAFYLFAAVIFTSWMMDNGRSNYASSAPAPAPAHHSIHDAAANSGAATTR